MKIKVERDSDMEDYVASTFLQSCEFQESVDLEAEVKNEIETDNVESEKVKPKRKRRRSKKLFFSQTEKYRSDKYQCKFKDCHFTAGDYAEVTEHVEEFHKSKLILKCHQCRFETLKMTELCIHLQQHYPSAPYRCDMPDCIFATAVLTELVIHFMEHDGKRPFSCDICNKSYRTFNQLSGHLPIHTDRQFTCDVCGKNFGRKGSMKQHRAIHCDQKAYLCETCGFSTKHQSHFIKHKQRHSGEILTCKYPECSYSTAMQFMMTQHMRRHMNMCKHACKVCGKFFAVRGKLLRHELIHLDKKLFKCKLCDYRTSRTDRMKLHITSHGMTFGPEMYEKVENTKKSEHGVASG